MIHRQRSILKDSLGGFNIMRFGAGPNGPIRTLGQYMLGSGATFGYGLLLQSPSLKLY